MSTLDTLASRAVYAARLFERSVHDEGPWSVGWGSLRVPAVRHLGERRVLFTANFATVPSVATDTLVLYCRDEPVSFKKVDGDEGLPVSFEIEWAVEMASAV